MNPILHPYASHIKTLWGAYPKTDGIHSRTYVAHIQATWGPIFKPYEVIIQTHEAHTRTL